ncbi:MAG TPA: hypothetical protein VFC30_06630 [Solirubrobacteraceae bacterium]|nr:hypothetical protein [Solirubrobacteraceae bacterium]
MRAIDDLLKEAFSTLLRLNVVALELEMLIPARAGEVGGLLWGAELAAIQQSENYALLRKLKAAHE